MYAFRMLVLFSLLVASLLALSELGERHAQAVSTESRSSYVTTNAGTPGVRMGNSKVSIDYRGKVGIGF